MRPALVVTMGWCRVCEYHEVRDGERWCVREKGQSCRKARKPKGCLRVEDERAGSK